MSKRTPGAAVLIIGGMHRSGTTLTARWLQASGLPIGERLLVSKYLHANPEGQHYEDLDFLELHRAILRDNGIAKEGFVSTQPIQVSDERRQQAQALIAARAGLPQWGWKEPRTCLFLDLWRDLLPDAKLLVVYRHYAQVVDSLLRRKLDHPRATHRAFYRLRYAPLANYVAQYLAVWDRYNRDLLHAVESAPESALVVHISDITDSSDAIARYCNSVWGFQLDPVPSEDIFIRDKLKKQTRYADAEMLDGLPEIVAQVEATYQALERWRGTSLEGLKRRTAAQE